MDVSLTIVFIVTCLAGFFFITGWIRSDLVAILVMLTLMSTGVLTTRESLSGFSEPAVAIIASMFIVSAALVNTGAAQKVANVILKLGNSEEKKITTLMMLAIGMIGAFMSSTAVMAIFLPIGVAIARKANLNQKRLLMPLSVAALISGMMTLVATAPNLIVSEALKERQLEPFSFFSFTPFGMVVLAVAMCFMMFFGRKLLSERTEGTTGQKRLTISDLLKRYELLQKFSRLRVLPTSPLIDRSVARVQMRDACRVELIGFEKQVSGKTHYETATAKSVFQNGDALYVSGTQSDLEKLKCEMCLSPLPFPRVEDISMFTSKIGLAEVMPVPESRLIGKTLRETSFYNRYKVIVLAIRRRGQAVDLDHGNVVIEFGDVLLVNGTWQDILSLRDQVNEFVLLTLPEEFRDLVKVEGKIRFIVPILCAMVGAMAFTNIPAVTIVMLTALALIFTKCVELKSIYNSIEWQSVVLVASLLPLATALDKTGGTTFISESLMTLLDGQPVIVMVMIVFAITTLLGYLVPNTATAVILAPVVIDASLALNVDPHALAITVAIACSASYAMPMSSPVNMLVLEPGPYKTVDFLRVGVPLQLLTMLATLVLVWVIYV